jgi:type VI secretion system secreted protein Hcp
MALNGFARLTLNGTALSGDVSVAQMGPVDVSADFIEVYELSFGASAGQAAASGRATGRRQYQPIRFVKRIDKSTPLLYRALSQNERVAGDVLLFDIDPIDGTVRHLFSVTFGNGTISSIESELPDTRNGEQSWDPFETVSIVFASITYTHEPTSTEYQDQIGRFV